MGKFDFIDDKECIPLVEYFNEQGLPTAMCCSGEKGHGFGLFYIYFKKEVGEQEVLSFMERHSITHTFPEKTCTYFSSMGWFCKRLFYPNDYFWCYIASSIERANMDLKMFKWIDKERENE